MNDYESLLRLMLRSRQNPQLSQAMEQLGDVLQSPEGQKLMQRLSTDGSGALQTAIAAAGRGDQRGAKLALAQILSTPEGAAFAQALTRRMEKK